MEYSDIPNPFGTEGPPHNEIPLFFIQKKISVMTELIRNKKNHNYLVINDLQAVDCRLNSVS
jgi:hypothetical protein